MDVVCESALDLAAAMLRLGLPLADDKLKVTATSRHLVESVCNRLGTLAGTAREAIDALGVDVQLMTFWRPGQASPIAVQTKRSKEMQERFRRLVRMQAQWIGPRDLVDAAGLGAATGTETHSLGGRAHDHVDRNDLLFARGISSPGFRKNETSTETHSLG